jgi:hypothetical protein
MNGTAKRHHKIENTFKRLKDWRTIAMRFDRRAGIFVSARALVIAPGGFISTHKDSREGDLTCVHFLTGGGVAQPVNSVGTPRFVIEDPSRYFDEGRLPYESRHGYSVNPRPGLSVFFPSHIPHNQHPYEGSEPHVQVVANFRVNLPVVIEERLFD